jgi:hypothetical protein
LINTLERNVVSQQTAFDEQQAAGARKAMPFPARRHAARVMYSESITAGLPMTDRELGQAFGLSARWGRARVSEVRVDLAELAKSANRPQETSDVASSSLERVPEDEPEPVDKTVPELGLVTRGPMVPVAGGPARTAMARHIRVRWGVRATLTLGVVASTVANILHANDNPISQTIAAWPPLALLVTIELISRVPVHGRALAALRFVATSSIAGIAAWVSYWHMAGVAARFGETGASAYLIPLTVDGLIVVASVCLVELGSRIGSITEEATR